MLIPCWQAGLSSFRALGAYVPPFSTRYMFGKVVYILVVVSLLPLTTRRHTGLRYRLLSTDNTDMGL